MNLSEQFEFSRDRTETHESALRAASLTDPTIHAALYKIRRGLATRDAALVEAVLALSTIRQTLLDELTRLRSKEIVVVAPCPHCGLFGNHLDSCEYEKFKAIADGRA